MLMLLSICILMDTLKTVSRIIQFIDTIENVTVLAFIQVMLLPTGFGNEKISEKRQCNLNFWFITAGGSLMASKQ